MSKSRWISKKWKITKSAKVVFNERERLDFSHGNNKKTKQKFTSHYFVLLAKHSKLLEKVMNLFYLFPPTLLGKCI